MKKRIMRAVLVFVLSFSVMVFMGIQRLEAQDTPVVYVDPPSSVALLGRNRTVTIKVANVTDLYGYDIWLDYNSTILNHTAVTVDGPGQVAPTNPAQRSSLDVSVLGSIKFSCVFLKLMGAPSFNGSGTLAWITFNATNLGNTTLHFNTMWTALFNSTGEKIPMDPPVDGSITVRLFVGGIWVPIEKFGLLAPYIGLTILLAVAVMTVGYVKKRKRQ